MTDDPRVRASARPPLLGGRVEVPPFELYEVRAGEGGTPVVLVHGLSGSTRWWRKNIPALARHHRVAAVDLIGFGSTRKFRRPTALPPSFDTLVETLARWISSSFDEKVHLVGHSMGGHLAIHLAARHPELIRSLVLIDSTGIPMTLSISARVRNLMYPVLSMFAFSLVLLWDFFRAGPTSIAVAGAKLLANDARDAMAKVSVPTLIMWGDRDPIVPLSFAHEMKTRIGGARVVVLPRAGHVAMWDNPSAFNDEVSSFLREVEGRRGGGAEGQEDLRPSAHPPLRPSFSWGVAGCIDKICYRQSGPAPQVVLIHGLGIATPYFAPLARELHARGWQVAAPDLPGCGYSGDVREPVSEYAHAILRWADEMELTRAVWVGHSIGGQLVEEIAAIAPDRCAGAIHISPIWHQSKHPWLRLGFALARDAVHEPASLVAHAIYAYWVSGLARVLKQARFFVPGAGRAPRFAERTLLVVGEHDPLADWRVLNALPREKVRRVPAYHGTVYSSPAAVADAIAPAIEAWLSRDPVV